MLTLDEPMAQDDFLDWAANGNSWTPIERGSSLIGRTRKEELNLVYRPFYNDSRPRVARRIP